MGALSEWREHVMIVLHDHNLKAWTFTKEFDGERFEFSGIVVITDARMIDKLSGGERVWWKDRNWCVSNAETVDYPGGVRYCLTGVYPC